MPGSDIPLPLAPGPALTALGMSPPRDRNLGQDLERERCHVWLGQRDELDLQLPWLITILDPGELNRAARYRRTEDRERYVLGRSILRLLLAAYLGFSDAGALKIDARCAGCGEDHGKPRCRSAALIGIDSSVSHAGALLAWGFSSRSSIGVDIEVVGPEADSAICAWALSSREQRSIESLPTPQRARAFYQAWTRKEAFSKAVGQGLDLRFGDIEVLGSSGPVALSSTPPGYDRSDWSLVDLQVPAGYAAAVAADQQLRAIEPRWITPGASRGMDGHDRAHSPK
jgi:4'-phosphopantetheinyl transferase